MTATSHSKSRSDKGTVRVDDLQEFKLALIELRHACFHVLGEFDGIESEALDSLREQIHLTGTTLTNYNARKLWRKKGET